VENKMLQLDRKLTLEQTNILEQLLAEQK